MSHKPGGAVSGTFPSLKLGRLVAYESGVERDFLFFAEYDPAITYYQEQPFCLTGLLADGTTHRYTPDFLVSYGLRQELVECKPAARCDHPHTRQQCELDENWAAEHNSSFRLVTDEELRTGYKLGNLKLLWRYSRLPPEPVLSASCLTLVQQQPGITVADLAASQQPTRPCQAVPSIYALLFHHRLRTDLAQPLAPDSRLYLEVSEWDDIS